MQVSNPNNVKIYNLTAGKSVPEVSLSAIKRHVIAVQYKPISTYVVLIFRNFSFDNCLMYLV